MRAERLLVHTSRLYHVLECQGVFVLTLHHKAHFGHHTLFKIHSYYHFILVR